MLCGIVINALDAPFFHGIKDSAIEDLYLTGAAHILIQRADHLVAKLQPDSWKWKVKIDLFYATVNVIVYFMHHCQNDMDHVIETGNPARPATTSHLVADTVAVWVHRSCHFLQLQSAVGFLLDVLGVHLSSSYAILEWD